MEITIIEGEARTAKKVLAYASKIRPTEAELRRSVDNLARLGPTGRVFVRKDSMDAWQWSIELELK